TPGWAVQTVDRETLVATDGIIQLRQHAAIRGRLNLPDMHRRIVGKVRFVPSDQPESLAAETAPLPPRVRDFLRVNSYELLTSAVDPQGIFVISGLPDGCTGSVILPDNLALSDGQLSMIATAP